MSAGNLEAFLARLYTDARLREAFLANPERATRAKGLDATEIEALKNIDRDGLEFAARSYAHKRAAHAHTGPRRSWMARLLDLVRRNRDERLW
jgi:hypothetical protein